MFCALFKSLTVHITGIEFQGCMWVGSIFAYYPTNGVLREDSLTCLVTLKDFGAISVGLMNGGSDNVANTFSADGLNAYFTTPATSTGSPDTSHISYRPLIHGDSFSFFCVDEMYVAASIPTIASNATGLDGILLVFIKLLLPLIVPLLTQLFNFTLTTLPFV
jgi:hypothetical protein